MSSLVEELETVQNDPVWSNKSFLLDFEEFLKGGNTTTYGYSNSQNNSKK